MGNTESTSENVNLQHSETIYEGVFIPKKVVYRLTYVSIDTIDKDGKNIHLRIPKTYKAWVASSQTLENYIEYYKDGLKKYNSFDDFSRFSVKYKKEYDEKYQKHMNVITEVNFLPRLEQ